MSWLEQAANGLQPFVLIQQAVVDHALVEQQAGRIDHVGRVERGKLLAGLVVQLVLSQPAAVKQAEVESHQGRTFFIRQPGEARQGAAPAGLGAQPHQLACFGVAQGHGGRQPVE